MTLENKFNAVRTLLEEHNKAVQELSPNPGQPLGGNPPPAGHVDIEYFFASLKAIGATTEDRAKQLRYEDILTCFGGTGSVTLPLLLAKDIAKIFRGNVSTKSESPSRPVSAKKADRMTPKELVEAFDPENADNTVGKRLQSIAKGQSFIVYLEGRLVDVESTYKLLMELKQGYPGRQFYTINEEIKPVYKIGELPDNFAEENPLYPGRPLRPDGTCDQTGRSWEGVPLCVRQLIRVAIGNNSVSIEKAHDWMDLAVQSDAMKMIRTRHHKASIEFDRLEKTGDLPTLKVILNSKGGAGNPRRPFDQGRKVDVKRPEIKRQPNPFYENWQCPPTYKNLFKPQIYTTPDYYKCNDGGWYAENTTNTWRKDNE